eukprot:4031079-Pyramimonas_sp.AAC.1
MSCLVLTEYSPRARSACRPRELHSNGSCLSLIWCSPRADSGCRHHEPCSKVYGRLLASCSPQRRSVCIFHGCHVGLGVLRTASRGEGVASH